MYKIGDKIYCKKTLEAHGNRHFIVGEYYEIINVISVSEEIIICGENCNSSFKYCDDEINYNTYKLFDYFETLRFCRAEKLKRLKNV